MDKETIIHKQKIKCGNHRLKDLYRLNMESDITI